MLVPISALAAIRSHCDKESSRYALGCILLERMADGAPVAIATDGRRLAAFTWVEPAAHPHKPENEAANSAFSFLLSADALATICGWKLDKKWLKTNPHLGFVYIPENLADDAPAVVSATDLSAVYRVERARGDGRFPKWRDVFSPQLFCDDGIDARTASISVDSRFLTEAATMASKLVNNEESRSLALTIDNRDSGKPMAIRAIHNGQRLAIVLIPLCSGANRGDYGQWNPTARPAADDADSAQAKLSHWANEALVAGALAGRLAKLAQESAYGAENRAIDAGLVQQLADDAEARYARIEAKRLEAAERVAHFAALAEAAAELAAQQAAENAEALAELGASMLEAAESATDAESADDSAADDMADAIFGSAAA